MKNNGPPNVPRTGLRICDNVGNLNIPPAVIPRDKK